MNEETKVQSLIVEGRNAVIEAFRSGKTVDKLYVLESILHWPNINKVFCKIRNIYFYNITTFNI